jgi:hypothetical protein
MKARRLLWPEPASSLAAAALLAAGFAAAALHSNTRVFLNVVTLLGFMIEPLLLCLPVCALC